MEKRIFRATAPAMLALAAAGVGGAVAAGPGGQAPDPMPGWSALGLAPVGASGAGVEAALADGRMALYALAAQAVRDKHQCIAALPDDRGRIEAAFGRMAGAANARVSASQWRAFERSLLDAEPVAGTASSLHCEAAVEGWSRFDARVADALAAQGELAQVDAMARDGRLDDPQRGSIGVLLGPSSVVQGVVEGGPAARAGIVAGDEIVAIDGRPVVGAAGVQAATARLRPGAEAEIELRRIRRDDGPRVETLRVRVPVAAADELEAVAAPR